MHRAAGGFLALAAVLCVSPARADVDPTGAWLISFTDALLGPVQAVVNFQRSGTDLTAYVERSTQVPLAPSDELTGSIDPLTGAFSVSGTHACAQGGSQPSSIAGTFSADGESLVGNIQTTFEGASPTTFCHPLSGSGTGARTSAACGNGTVDAGESCDAGPAGSPCCTVGCTPVAAGRACTLTDYVCVFVFPCTGCFRNLCDGAGACAQTPRPAGTVCRAAASECDLPETCDGVSLACPADQGVPGLDTDGDGLNDACDPCTNGAAISGPQLTLKHLTSTTDHRMSLRGILALPDPASIDPTQHGVRLVIDGQDGRRIADVTAPASSAAWKTRSSGWTFHDAPTGLTVRLTRDDSSPGTMRVMLRGVHVSTAVPTATDLPVKATLVLDPPHAISGLCGEAVFPGPPGTNPSCELGRGGASLICR